MKHQAWALAALITFAHTGQAAAQARASSPALDSARTLLSKYSDPVAAIRDGYLSSVFCVEYPQGGALGEERFPAGGMGVHFLNMGYVGQMPDPARPQVLIYEQGSGDALRLVAAEWFVPVAASATAPSIFGHQLLGPMHGHEPIMPADLHHWDLHVWLWKDNPAGVFTSTNPTVSCRDGRWTMRDDRPTLVHH